MSHFVVHRESTSGQCDAGIRGSNIGSHTAGVSNLDNCEGSNRAMCVLV